MEKRAAAAFNRCWELLEQPSSPERDSELIASALASKADWLEVGGPEQWATSDWMLSRAFAAIGDGERAVAAALDSLQQPLADLPYWLQASLWEGLARAHAANRDRMSAVSAAAQCRLLLNQESDPEDAALIAGQLGELDL